MVLTNNTSVELRREVKLLAEKAIGRFISEPRPVTFSATEASAVIRHYDFESKDQPENIILCRLVMLLLLARRKAQNMRNALIYEEKRGTIEALLWILKEEYRNREKFDTEVDDGSNVWIINEPSSHVPTPPIEPSTVHTAKSSPPEPARDITGWINIDGIPVPAADKRVPKPGAVKEWDEASKLHESVRSTGSTFEGCALSSPDSKYNCNLTPDQIRILAEVGDPLAMRKEWLVFYRTSGQRYQIKPEFAWVLFEKKGNQFPISLSRMKLVFPKYEMVMERFDELKQTDKDMEDMEAAASGKPAGPTKRPATDAAVLSAKSTKRPASSTDATELSTKFAKRPASSIDAADLSARPTKIPATDVAVLSTKSTKRPASSTDVAVLSAKSTKDSVSLTNAADTSTKFAERPTSSTDAADTSTKFAKRPASSTDPANTSTKFAKRPASSTDAADTSTKFAKRPASSTDPADTSTNFTKRPASSTDTPISPAVASRLNPKLQTPRKRSSHDEDKINEPENKYGPKYRSPWKKAGAK